MELCKNLMKQTLGEGATVPFPDSESHMAKHSQKDAPNQHKGD